jgi:hypothetical protein
MFLATRTGWMRALAALVLFGLTAEPVLATMANTIHLPGGNQRVRHGVRVQIDPHWVDGNGYRPVRVTVTATPGPTQRDRHFQVELQSSGSIVSLEPLVEDLATGTEQVRGAGLAVPSLYFVGIALFVITLGLNLIADRYVRAVRIKY